MALDTTKIRRRLPQPPTDGSPAMDGPQADPLPAPRRPVRPAASGRTDPAPAGGKPVPMDGRSLRATGRTTQLNLKVSDDTKRRFLALAQERGVMLVDLFEMALDALETKRSR